MRLAIGYPDRGTERDLLRATKEDERPGRRGRAGADVPVVGPDEVVKLMADVRAVAIPEVVEEYLLDLVRATRSDPRFVRGVSIRGAQALHRAAQAHAFVQGRRYVVPEDVRIVAPAVLGHRVLARSGAAGEGGEHAVLALLDDLPSPL
jgi:MoxR-like ATPase